MESRLRQIIADLFNISEDRISEQSSPDTISDWDSMGHINLIMVLEEEFDISLTADEVAEMQSVKDIVQILIKHAAN